MTPAPDPRRDAVRRIQVLVPAGKGPKGDTGQRGERGLSVLQGRAVVFLFLVAVALALFAVFWVSHAVNAARADQARQGQMVKQKICTTMSKLAALPPPAGNPATNPSRAYDQDMHATLDQLGPDLGCN